MSRNGSSADREACSDSFERMEELRRREGRRRYVKTTMGERIEGSFELSELGRELRKSLRSKP